MNEEELFKNEENIEESEEIIEEDSGSGSADPEDSISREEIIDIMREIVEEQSSEEVPEEEVPSSVSETVSENSIDYTPYLEQILRDLEEQSVSTVSQNEITNKSLTEKPLSDFTVSEGLLCFLVIFILVKALIKLIEKYTPKI